MISYSKVILSTAAMTGTAVNTSSALWVGTAPLFGIQAIRTGDATGTVKLQASCSAKRPNTLNENTPVVIADDEWVDIPDSEYSVAGAEDYVWSYDGPGFDWVRAVYTNATGTGNITINANVKSNEIVG